MLYVPQNGIITPNVMRVEDSIWMVIWVAVGGRGRLWGAVAGAIAGELHILDAHLGHAARMAVHPGRVVPGGPRVSRWLSASSG